MRILQSVLLATFVSSCISPAFAKKYPITGHYVNDDQMITGIVVNSLPDLDLTTVNYNTIPNDGVWDKAYSDPGCHILVSLTFKRIANWTGPGTPAGTAEYDGSISGHVYHGNGEASSCLQNPSLYSDIYNAGTQYVGGDTLLVSVNGMTVTCTSMAYVYAGTGSIAPYADDQEAYAFAGCDIAIH